MARKHRGGSRSNMRYSWSTSTFDQVAASTTQAVFGIVSLDEGILHEATLMRTRGAFLVTAIADAVADSDVLALGLAVIPLTSALVGGASVPGPISDGGAGYWLWHEFIGLDAVSLSAGDPNARSVIYRGVIDAKAMRKMPPDSALVFVAQLLTGDFVSVSLTGGFRALLGS